MCSKAAGLFLLISLTLCAVIDLQTAQDANSLVQKNENVTTQLTGDRGRKLQLKQSLPSVVKADLAESITSQHIAQSVFDSSGNILTRGSKSTRNGKNNVTSGKISLGKEEKNQKSVDQKKQQAKCKDDDKQCKKQEQSDEEFPMLSVPNDGSAPDQQANNDQQQVVQDENVEEGDQESNNQEPVLEQSEEEAPQAEDTTEGEEDNQQDDDQTNEQNQDSDPEEEDVQDEDEKQNFQQYQSQYSRNYDPQQEPLRMNYFNKNWERIKKHNAMESSFELEQNEFADLSVEEFHEKYLMTEMPQMPAITAPPMSVPPQYQMKPVDWRENMGPVQHQGKCGSCWAFSVVNVIEAMFKIESEDPIQFSIQQLVDCCNQGCNGCRGGWPVSAVSYLSQSGIAMGQDYPYVSAQQDCQTQVSTNNIIDPISPYSQIRGEEGLAYALESGPVSVIMDATTWDQLYRGGVFDQCSSKKIAYNHAVICAGVTKEGNWIVRNSWGASWGDNGYIYLPPGNSCGILDMGIIPNIVSFDLGIGMAPPE